MVQQLESARAKIARGAQHFAVLARACQDFTDSQPHEVVVAFEPAERCWVARLRVREHPPHNLSLVLGDLVHNARSALDHAAWQVACLRCSEDDLMKPRVRPGISFPITQHPNEFAAHPLLRYIPEEAVEVFERTQPYQGSAGTERHWLALLNRMWNADKHRLLHPTFALTWLGKTTFAPGGIFLEDFEGGAEIESLISEDQGIEDGAKVALVRFAAGPHPRTQTVRVQQQPPAHIVFGAGRGMFGGEKPGRGAIRDGAVVDDEDEPERRGD